MTTTADAIVRDLAASDPTFFDAREDRHCALCGADLPPSFVVVRPTDHFAGCLWLRARELVAGAP